MTAPVVGQVVLLKTQSSPTVRIAPAVVSLVIDENTVNCDALIDSTADWPVSGTPYTHPCVLYTSVARGTGVGQWQEAELPPTVTAAIQAAVAAATSGLASTSYVDTEVDTCVALPGAGTHPSLALNTPRQPSTTRPVRVTVSGTWSWSLTALGSVSGTATLQSDATSSPTTAQGVAPFARSLTVGVTVGESGTFPFQLTYDVPAGHYYQLATSGGGTFAITLVTEQVL